MGQPGPAGADGRNGSDGAMGQPGPAGANGNDGAQGPMGPMGLQGDVGPTGPQGNDGFQGPQGDVGFTGAQGPMGPMGIQGDVGPTGPQGNDGFQGPQGDVGFTGAQGPMGPMGPPGLDNFYSIGGSTTFRSIGINIDSSGYPRNLYVLVLPDYNSSVYYFDASTLEGSSISDTTYPCLSEIETIDSNLIPSPGQVVRIVYFGTATNIKPLTIANLPPIYVAGGGNSKTTISVQGCATFMWSGSGWLLLSTTG